MNDGSHLLQDAFIEELLQFLVTVVDAELLEAVVFEVLCKTQIEARSQRCCVTIKESLTSDTILGNHTLYGCFDVSVMCISRKWEL